MKKILFLSVLAISVTAQLHADYDLTIDNKTKWSIYVQIQGNGGTGCETPDSGGWLAANTKSSWFIGNCTPSVKIIYPSGPDTSITPDIYHNNFTVSQDNNGVFHCQLEK